MATLKVKVNGSDFAISADQTTPLLSVLRDHLHLTGAKPGCGEGQCGACTVLLDGIAVHSCITAIGDVGGRSVVTIEGLAHGSKLDRVQQAFLEHSAFQCGFCTPGMIMATVALLNRNASPTVDEIRAGLNGNVCRCGTYSRIVRAVQQAAEGPQHA